MTAAKGFLDGPDDGPDDGEVDALAARVRALPPSAGSSRVVAVDGPSGSGKTTVADRLAAALGGAPVVHLDDLYPGWDGLDGVVPRLVDGVLRPLAEGRPAAYRRWDWAARTDGPLVPVPAAPVLVVEGAGCGARACAPYLALLAWVDGPPAWRRRRALDRDGAMYAPHWNRWAAQERAHFARERTADRADVRLCSTGAAARRGDPGPSRPDDTARPGRPRMGDHPARG